MSAAASGFVPDPSWPTILELATRLWGQPTDWSHDRNEVRFGSNGSKRVKLREMVWKDEDGAGGKAGGGYVAIWALAFPGEPLPPRTNGQSRPQTATAKPNGQGQGPKPWDNVGTAYSYRDADGVLIAQNVRMKPGYPSRFLQRRPDPSNRSGWRWSTKGLDIPLYRLPELLAADAATTIWITEGEKDADNLAQPGLIATTNIAGAGHWDAARHNGEFAGRPVVILEDNDDAGRARSALIAPGLIGVAASVKVLALPDLPPKGDVSDWLAAGGTVEELERLAGATPDYQPPAAPERGTEETFLSSDEAEAAWRDTDPDAPPRTDPRPEPPPPDADDWPEPVDFMSATDLGVPILTERHVPPSLWSFIIDNAERMGVATSSVALCAIVSCSAAINEEWQLQPKRRDYEWTEGARLWGGIVGPPSVLKSPIIAATTKPVEMLDIKGHEDWNAAQIAHKEWEEVGDETVAEPQTPPRSRYIVESVTIEALSEVLRDDSGGKLRAPLGKVLCRQDELSEFLGNMDRYSKGSDRPAWLRANNGGRYVVDRIGRGSFPVKSWSCCLLGGIQPDVIRRIVKQGDDDGLIQRFMLDVPGPQPRGLDRAPNRAARDLYRALFPALAALHPGRDDEGYVRPVTLHSDAHAAREDIDVLAVALAAMPDASARLQSTFGKWPGLFARLCLTFHLIEAAASRVRNPGGLHPVLHVVTAETADRVRRYMRGILAPSLRRADAMMFATVQTEHAAAIARYILAERLDRITMRQLMRYGPLALRAPEERPARDSVMEGLCLFGWLRPVLRDAQPPIAWTVNPNVHRLYAERAAAERVRRAAMKETIDRAFGAQGTGDDC